MTLCVASFFILKADAGPDSAKKMGSTHMAVAGAEAKCAKRLPEHDFAIMQ